MMRFLLVALALFWAGAAQAELKWQSTGPGGGGAFQSPAQSASGTVIVGSDLSGAYRSIDGGAHWQALGLDHGLGTTHVDSVAFDPAHEGVVLLAADDGLYRSADCGKAATDKCNFQKMLAGYATAVAVGDHNVAYVAGLNGFCQPGPLLARSADGGLSWHKAQAAGLPRNANVMALRLQPGNPKMVIALSSPWRFASPGACGAGWPDAAPAKAYISSDGGDHFAALDVEASQASAFTADAAFDLADPKRIWLSVAPAQNESPASKGDGEVWLSDGAAGPGQDFKRISAEHSGQIWPLRDGSIRLIDLRRVRPWFNTPIATKDEAGFWALKADGTATHVTSPQDYARWDMGWTGLAHNPQPSLNGNLQTVFFADDQNAWWVDDQFIYRTTDGGKTVNQSFTNKVASGFVSRKLDNAVPGVLVPSPADPNLLYAGYFDMGCWSTHAALAGNDQLAWADCNGPKSQAVPGVPLAASPLNGNWNGYGGNTSALAVDPKDPQTFWAVHAAHSFDFGNEQAGFPKITVSHDGFKTWTEITGNFTALSKGAAITDLKVDEPAVGKRRLWAAAGNRLFKLEDGGKDWQAVATPCDGGLQVLALQGRAMLAGGAKGVCYSHDAGASWAAWKNAMSLGEPRASWWAAFGASAQGVTDFAFVPGAPEQIYMTVMIPDWANDSNIAGLWKSVDGGVNWSQVKGLAEGHLERNFMRSVAINPKNPKMIVVGTSIASYAGGYLPAIKNMGAFVSRDGGASWSKAPENDGLAWPFITRLRFTGGEHPRLFGISPGQGIVYADGSGGE
ncbi:WD40/YVTN/BNR-like repeat-containing protein [Aestuariivirga litoralis]|uniref:WD40/YVTN/BNR-like repeat-containing protein n=1 Tax=Aestuariivirga litoralis TaxID=2650924 RepID=UPI0018C6C146|nr:hypothetical protein [Aestuariivirga litoralis]MBG1231103.1 hypothetical protein [Aestuariivirga litoralis]